MRELSAAIKKVLASESFQMEDLVEIKFPQYSDGVTEYPEVVMKLAGSDIKINGEQYTGSLRGIGQIRYSIGSAPDNASIEIENVSRTMGHFLTSNRKLDNARATIKRAFLTDSGWELDTLFADGYLRDIKVNGNSVSLTLVSEMSRKGAAVANRTVTQRCWWIFKGYGCMWTIDQTGDPTFCDKGKDTPNGCIAHSNLPQFGAVPAFTTLLAGTPVNSVGGGELVGGYDRFPNNFSDPDNLGWCIKPDSYVYVWVGDEIIPTRADKIQPNEIVLSMNLFGGVEKVKVNQVLTGNTSRLLTIHTEEFSISCSPMHPLITTLGDSKGTPASKLKVGQQVMCFKDGMMFSQDIVAIESVDIESSVITFSLDQRHTFIASNELNGGIVNHNLKPMSRDGYMRWDSPLQDARLMN